MATTADIDVHTAVGKFLTRRLSTPDSRPGEDAAEEIQALLESIAIALLLRPQIVLPLLLRAKNSLQQIVQADIDILTFLQKALAEVENPDRGVTDTSDLVEAQTALVELDRIGRVGTDVQAFGRYQAAIRRFLDAQLAATLKRTGSGEFERGGAEAKADIFRMLPTFEATHRVLIARLTSLAGAVTDFRSVDLTRLVSIRTLTRVRSSLRQIRQRIEARRLSKTVAAVELLAGAAALTSIARTVDVFDPTLDTGSTPPQRTITARAEAVPATVQSSPGPWTLGAAPWRFVGISNPLAATATAFDFELPGPGASGRAYLASEQGAPTVAIPPGGTLYLLLRQSTTDTHAEFSVTVTSGANVTWATLAADITTATGGDVTAIETPGTNGLLLYSSDVAYDQLTVLPASSGQDGTTTDLGTSPSVHAAVGFAPYQTSLPVGHFTPSALAAAVRHQLPDVVVTTGTDRIELTSTATDVRASSLQFNDAGTNAVQAIFGFTGLIEAAPRYLELVEDGVAQPPRDLGVYIGSRITTAEDPVSGSALRTLNNEPVTDIEGTAIYLDLPLPRGEDLAVTITAPDAFAVQAILQILADFAGVFAGDAAAVRQSVSPALSSPTRAQVADAQRTVTRVLEKLTNADGSGLWDRLRTLSVRPDRSRYHADMHRLLTALEERGLDRAATLLSTGQFSAFFALDKNVSSRSTRFLRAMEQTVTTDLPTSTLEADIEDDIHPAGVNPRDTLQGVERAEED